jgi:hypothetical protein
VRSASRSPHPRHLLAGLASAGLVLVLHGWLLSGWQRGPDAGRKPLAEAPRAVHVRQIAAPAAAAQAEPASEPVPRPSPRAARPAAPLVVAPPRPAVPPAPPATAVELVASPAPASTVGEEGNVDVQPPPVEAPVYATRLAPPATLHYALRRGTASGQAVLRWSVDGGRYALSLQGHLPAAPKVGWASQGAIDAHGIAPDRYTESRRGRELRAANFQRDRARITFSGPQLEYPLPPGAQDRISWMLQLGAILAADAGLEAAGRQVLLFVAGSRGDAEVWTFVAQGPETVDLPGAGSLQTVLLRREARGPYDTQVEVWLDPARHHLPVRVDLTQRGDRTQFVLEQLTVP